MAVFPLDPETLLAEPDAAKATAKPYAERYQSAVPYPHICIDDFLPEAALEHVLDDLRQLPEPEDSFSRAQENLKSSYIPERLPRYTRELFYFFNSRPFVLFLEELTGIKGLIPDPYFGGAGIHRVGHGGHLDIHADFNHHPKLNLERRLNVLIYLNKDWKKEYGGSFEIWDKEMTKQEAEFVPLFNRMVCFSTGSDTFHGNPQKVNHPAGLPRQSIALYYYTATWNSTRKSHTTLFKPRPNTEDQRDAVVARHETLQDVLPPVIFRRVIGPLSRLGF